MSTTYATPLRIAADHPALPGHFPGNPMVPGVVVLERVAAALRAWRGERVTAIDVKFVRPLRAAEDARIALHEDGARVRFEVTLVTGDALARGVVTAVRA